MSYAARLDSRRNEPDGPILETVSELTARIKNSLEQGFSSVAITGEISNLSRPRSGHVYLSLKDEGAMIRAVIWSSDASRIAIDLADGARVRCQGKLAVYAPRGEYQVVIRRIELDGAGRLDQILRERRDKLAREGLFNADRKRPLHRFPRRVVVVSSPTGAAIRDILQIMTRRWPLVEILVAPARVQGIGADLDVVAAIQAADQIAGLDLIIVARGGGSLEDLWTFNEENVVRAIAAARVPVMTAIGHEIDVTLADHVADRRANTPSEAAELAVPDLNEIVQRLDDLADRIERTMGSRIRDVSRRLELARRRMPAALALLIAAHRARMDRAGHRLPTTLAASIEKRRHALDRAGDRLAAVIPNRVTKARARIEPIAPRLATAVASLIERRGHALERLAASLTALDPAGVLRRGYSMTLRARDQAIVRSPADLEPGETLITVLANGQIASKALPPGTELADGSGGAGAGDDVGKVAPG